MAHKTKRTAVYLLTATIAFTGMGMTAQASSILPGGGVSLALENGNKLEDVTEDKSALPIQSIIENIPLANSDAAQAEPTEEDMFRNLVIAQVDSYVNVRSTSSEEGEILGKLYDNSVGTFISEENGWYQINSGSVTGYVKAEYCVTGDAAVEIAKQVGKRIATVTTETLYVRAEASTECDIIGMVPQAADLLVMEETEGWVKVDIEEGQGWISTEYVSLHSEFVQAESREEEERRLAKEEEERRKAQAAAAAAQAAQAAANASTTQEEITYAVSGGSEMGQAVANYALQFVGNPYVYGGTSLTNGADCSGFVMSVYANFGVSLPHSDAGDRTQGYGVDGLANAQPGDIVCYSGHVGIYIGGGQIVHASSSRTDRKSVV